jgi:hypothetical protein
LQSVRYLTSGFDTESRLAVGILAEGDSQSSSATTVTVDTVDAGIGLDAPKPSDVEPAAMSD